MELTTLAQQVLKAKLKENGLTSKGYDWFKKIDGGYLMIHLKKSTFSNKANGYNSEVMIYSISEEEMTEPIADIWMSQQLDHISLTDLVPEYGFFTEGLNGGFFDFSIKERDNRSGKEYSVQQWVDIVTNIVDTFLLPFLKCIDSIDAFNTFKREVEVKKKSKDAMIYRFFSILMMSGACLCEANKKGLLGYMENAQLSACDIRDNSALLDRFLDLYSAQYRRMNEATIRKMLAEVLEESN